MGRFEGKVALVTGAASGIGEAVAERFVAEGARVIGTDIDVESLDRLSDRLGSRFTAVVSDAGNVEHIEALTARIESEFGCLDVLVNNAGWAKLGSVEQVTPEDYAAQMAVLLTGPVFLIQKLARLLRKSSNGSVVNISSASALFTMPGYCPYGLAKAALHKLTEDSVIQVPGIRHNTIMPGFIATPILTKVYGEAVIEQVSTVLQQINPVPRIGQPTDIANAAAFLASDEASYITGANLVVDGGMIRLHPAATLQPTT